MDNKHDIVIGFTGDISFTGIFKQKIRADKEIFNEPILNHFQSADFNVINLEGPATDSNSFIRNNGLVVSPQQSVDYLTKRNIRCYNLANNHLFDNGVDGFTDTVDGISKNKGVCFGAGLNIAQAIKPIILEKNDVSVAMIGVCHKEGMIANKKDPGVLCIDNNLGLIRKKLSELKKNNNWVILNYHGGEEYTRIPMPSRRRLLRKLTNFDCDIIIAHHPHVYQGHEIYNKKHIFYSLGNFVFDIPNHKNIQYIDLSAILKCSFSKSSFSFSFVPTIINTENGKIEIGSNDFHKTIDYLSQKLNNSYYKNWLIEAHRTFFKSKKPNLDENKNLARRHQSLFSLVKDGRNISRFLALLNSPNKRSLFIGSLLYKILWKLKVINEKS